MKAEPKTMVEALRCVIKWLHYSVEVMLVCVRWYVAYSLSLRHGT
jgi:transposase-like protein